MESITVRQFLGNLQIYIDPKYDIETFIVQHGLWEPHIVAAIQYLVEPGFVCIDVGANAGYHSLAMAQKGGEVLAFEPDGINFERLQKNLTLNPQIAEKIKTFREGLSDQAGSLNVFRSGDNNHRGNSYLSERADPQKWTNLECGEPEECRVTTLDAVLQGGQVNFMKIDVEGMELKVLTGARESVERWQPTIIFESLMTEMDRAKNLAVQEFLGALGYHFFYVDLTTFILKPTRFPALKHDTVAIHTTRLSTYRDYMDLKT